MMRLAVGLLAAGMLSLSAASALAFSQQTLVSPGNGYSTLTDPDSKPAEPDNHSSGQGLRPFGSSGPTVQFGAQHGQSSTFGSGNTRNAPPDPYYRPLNGN
jgi:hypothetical protein